MTKRFAVMDGVVMLYEVSGDELYMSGGLVAVYQNNAIKIVFNLPPGQSIMWVTDVVGRERTLNG